ncbi:putative 4-hydroxybutyrate-CoA transferase/hydrolase [Rhodoferax ferrireducens T118]|uniref:Putative 4-hydroxybutyrate-CoA transferase/hydrolase n=1 Tax=Albidiferax ferrireducens (strain ATCC BAA-621 / DSM 15236 / T118) TaxID=338969 RepID=Q21QT5_ALBFT|nr:acetyl-CoA hydrolase/transferase C-terminal domain-containing protein [Rhodoferax ferrireducens]ABD71868.1 putative 4-hydroxybutyrate-CoA transferase/hydrolase [Rhodoferax ferrireducens T118]
MHHYPSASDLPWREILHPGAKLACSQMTSEPMALIASLANALAQTPPPHMPASLLIGTPFSTATQALPQDMAIATFGGMGAAATMARSRRLTVFPIHYSVSEHWCTKYAADVALLGLARDAATGRLYLGASHGYAIKAARTAKIVVAEVNAMAPCVHGGELPEDLSLTHIVESSYPLVESLTATAGATERAIATHVATQVQDGATIQIGIGSLANAVAEGLAGHRRLSIHTGLMTEPLWALVMSGAADNSYRRDYPGVSVISAIYGNAALYRVVELNQAVRMAPPAVTHGITSLAALPRFTAINSGLEVDLYGQVNSELAGGRYVGGIGGLNDFVRGAAASLNGLSIIALPARRRGRNGDISGIVSRLSGPATISASDADMVITEFGVASLRGASRAQRATRLIAIAHPDDREQLEGALASLDIS